MNITLEIWKIDLVLSINPIVSSLYSYDLSGSGECFLTNFVPLSRAGHFRIVTDFSGPTNLPLTVVYFMEFSSFVTFNDKGEIEKSFTA